ncbi:hypothetical protein DNL40_02630 [Xylanimonas oleitrophica]|uniref:Uncharacterized protein n=1 Tax=Xylanimonas oleitrophica TaxID=2607479 RepID=A0A2W5X498_9MICO|nr:hypothetical protein [Xylanimonas oleitrophica]PZR55285.1 hypothetical protein DNL40_02630 [Xylanimonas oleitrophica]
MTADVMQRLAEMQAQAERVHRFGGIEQEVADDVRGLVAFAREVLALADERDPTVSGSLLVREVRNIAATTLGGEGRG